MNWLRKLTYNPDKRLAQVNIFALVLASDQFLYAPSLELFVGAPGHLAWPVAWTAPAFAMTLWITRHHPLAARIWVPLIGIINTVIAVLALGYASGAWVFFLPSLTLAGFLLYKNERLALVALSSLAFAALIFLPHGYESMTPDIAIAIARLNAGSALVLTGFIGWMFGSMKSQ